MFKKKHPTVSTTLIACLVCSILMACDNGSSGTSSPSTAVTATPGSLEAEIQMLESQGKLPKIDRSDDLKGPDADGNGVRDDIDAYVSSLPITEGQKMAIKKEARFYGHALTVDLRNEVALQAVFDESMMATECIGQFFEGKDREAQEFVDLVRSYTFNTKARTQRYLAYDKALNGMGARLPDRCEE